jgi:hypothetical protein
MTEAFVYTSTIVFALLFGFWTGSNLLNKFLKLGFFGLTLFGSFVSLQLLGYMVRV